MDDVGLRFVIFRSLLDGTNHRLLCSALLLSTDVLRFATACEAGDPLTTSFDR